MDIHKLSILFLLHQSFNELLSSMKNIVRGHMELSLEVPHSKNNSI